MHNLDENHFWIDDFVVEVQMTRQTAFYHQGTEKKLNAVERYLDSYLKVMSKQHYLQTIYIDAFAGTGTIPLEKDTHSGPRLIDADEFAVGSALRALQLARRFSKYIFIDQSGDKLRELEATIAALNLNSVNVEYKQGDAGKVLMDLAPALGRTNVRAVVFLDPFGNQVRWELLEALAKTRHVDLLYLFPAMLGVYRQIGNASAKMNSDQERSLDDLFGPHDWRKAFIAQRSELDLFGERTERFKAASVADITHFQIRCMKTIFEGCVLDEWLPLGRKGAHWYSLLFAMANPNPRAVEIGKSIAKHIMTKI